MSDFHSLGAIDGQREPGHLVDEVELGGIARLELVEVLLGALLNAVRIFVGQAGHDSAAAAAVLVGVQTTDLFFNQWT